ncbi:rhodanese-like domain-containing protein [Glaciibacter flavus]|uniref:rhodanese-like domain-containing protein n=1 Tax=Orlajensenia flava TaxID=2565934 RepID=UPI003AFFCAF2
MESIDPVALAALRADGGAASAPIIDVREVDEVDVVRVVDTVNIPMSAFLDRIDEVPTDDRIYVMCHVGGRSAQVTTYLEQRGYDVVNVAGGIQGWENAGLPVEHGR